MLSNLSSVVSEETTARFYTNVFVRRCQESMLAYQSDGGVLGALCIGSLSERLMTSHPSDRSRRSATAEGDRRISNLMLGSSQLKTTLNTRRRGSVFRVGRDE